MRLWDYLNDPVKGRQRVTTYAAACIVGTTLFLFVAMAFGWSKWPDLPSGVQAVLLLMLGMTLGAAAITPKEPPAQ